MTLERQAWLNGLKEGDEVAIGYLSWDGGSFSPLAVARITKITDTRRLCLGDRIFNSDGTGRGTGNRGKRLAPVTDEVRALARIREEEKAQKDRRAANLQRLQYRINWNGLSNETLEKVIGVLDAAKPAGAGAGA